VADHGPPTESGGLLVGVGTEHDVAEQPDSAAPQDLEGELEAGEAAFHVARPAAVQEAVTDYGLEGVCVPVLPLTDVDGVDVAIEEQAAPTSFALDLRDKLWPPPELERGVKEGVVRPNRFGLEHLDVRPGGFEALL